MSSCEDLESWSESTTFYYETNSCQRTSYLAIESVPLNKMDSTDPLIHDDLVGMKNALENTAEKGENAGNQHFLLFPLCFLLY